MEKSKHSSYLQAHRSNKAINEKQKMTNSRLPTSAALTAGFLAISAEAEAGCNYHCLQYSPNGNCIQSSSTGASC